MSPPLSPKRAPGASTPWHRRLAPHSARPWVLLPEDLRLGPQGARPWASLPEDLVQLIGWRVLAGDLLDYVRLNAVCAHWNRSTVRPRGRGLVDPRFHPRCWMLLPEGHGLYPGHPHLGGYVRFFNLSTGVFVRVHLPLFDNHIVLDSIDGLLLLLLHRDHGTDIFLLHPFTGDIAEFPPLLSLLPQMEPQARYLNMSEDRKLRKLLHFLGWLSAAVTVSNAGTITVILVLVTKSHVAHATTGDERWTLSARKLPLLLEPPVFFQGKMYIVSRLFRERKVVCILQIDPPQLNSEEQTLSLPPPVMIAKCPPLVGNTGALIHLVECGSELMLVGRVSDASGAHLVVYRVADLICGSITPIKDIGDHALFLGERSICVSSNKGFPSVLGNSITCRNVSTIRIPQVGARRRKRGEQYDLHTDTWSPTQNPQVRIGRLERDEQYDLRTGTWSPAIDGDIPYGVSLASPYSLVRHIYTCCFRSYWDKGVICGGATTPDWSVKPNFWPRVTSM